MEEILSPYCVLVAEEEMIRLNWLVEEFEMVIDSICYILEIWSNGHLNNQSSQENNISQGPNLPDSIKAIELYFIFHGFNKSKMKRSVSLIILRVTIFFANNFWNDSHFDETPQSSLTKALIFPFTDCFIFFLVCLIKHCKPICLILSNLFVHQIRLNN